MKFLEELRMQATFTQILNEKDLDDAKRNYLYRPYWNK